LTPIYKRCPGAHAHLRTRFWRRPRARPARTSPLRRLLSARRYSAARLLPPRSHTRPRIYPPVHASIHRGNTFRQLRLARAIASGTLKPLTCAAAQEHRNRARPAQHQGQLEGMFARELGLGGPASSTGPVGDDRCSFCTRCVFPVVLLPLPLTAVRTLAALPLGRSPH
jgi:hypothetical protein